MATFRWVVDNKDYEQKRLDRSTVRTWKKYYGGLNKNWKPEMGMYKDELEDLEKVYVNTMKSIEGEIRNATPDVLSWMQEFVSLHNQYDAVSEKLEVLQEKMGKKEDE